MFGENFLNRITHKKPIESESVARTAEKTPSISELIDTLDTEINRNKIDLARHGIDENTTPIFSMTIDHDEEASLPIINHDIREQSNATEHSDFTCTPQSTEDLRNILHEHYRQSFDTRKIRTSLERRDIDASQHDTVIGKLFDRMVGKTVAAFTADVTRQLIDAGFDSQQADEYIAWRFSTLSPDDALTVIHTAHGERISTENIVNDTQIAQFRARNNAPDDATNDHHHFTSRDIDDLIERALNE